MSMPEEYRRFPHVTDEPYEARRARMALAHDDGASDAVDEAVRDALSVSCSSYCYGGSPRFDVAEALAELAGAGWRLVRAPEPAALYRGQA